MKYTAERKLEVAYHPRAECNDCAWHVGSAATSRDEAKSHVRDTGHEVVVISEKTALYGPKKGT